MYESNDPLGAISRARALQRGLTDAQLRARALSRPFHGVRTKTVPMTHLDLVQAYAVRLRSDQFYSHETALVIWGAWLRRPIGVHDPLNVGAVLPLRPPQTRNVAGHKFAAGGVEVVKHEGFRVSDPASTWVSLRSSLEVRDLVTIADYFVRDQTGRSGAPQPVCSIDDLERRVEGLRGGDVRALRDALPLVSTASASRPETLLRLLLAEARLPAFQVNVPILDAGGSPIAIGDLVSYEFKVVVEYDGRHHDLSDKQRERDRQRRHDLALAGWLIVTVVSGGLDRDASRTIREVREAFRAHGWVG
jgi:very-short-patch-repair endonuclease